MKRASSITVVFLFATLLIVTASTSSEFEVDVIEAVAQFEFGPSWNNNETLVFFAGTAPTVSDPQLNLFRVNSDGSSRQQLTDTPGRDWQPWFSSDGRTIYFSSERGGNPEIYAMTADGSSVNALTSNGANNFTPFPSPNNRLLAFASNMNGQMDLYLLNLENGDITQLTDQTSQDWLPSWSPDGTRLAFISNRNGNDDVFMFDFTEGVVDAPLIQLTTDGGIDTRVNWYNRNMIVWESNRGGNFDLFSAVIENDALAHIRQLTVAPENDFGRPAFSPKGDRMAFGTLRFGSAQVVITDIVMPFSQTLDRNDNNQLDDDEVVQAIQLWAAGGIVSGMDRPLSDDLMLRLIDLWARAWPIDTVL